MTFRLFAALVLLSVAAVVVFRAATRSATGPDAAGGPAGCRHDTAYDNGAENGNDAGGPHQHVKRPVYTVDPPAGGPHEAEPADPGDYADGQAPVDGRLVRAMEQGFVVLWHRPGLDPADRRLVDALSDEFGRALIVVPRTTLSGRAAVTAWHRRLLCDDIDPVAVSDFVRANTDRGPEHGHV